VENNPSESVQIVKKEQQPMVVSQEKAEGATVLLVNVKRQMKVYPIQEHELTMLQSLSGNKTFWSSVGSGAVSFLLVCCWEWSQMPKDHEMSVFSKLIMVILLVVAVFSFGRAWWKKHTINKRLQQILSESYTE
jgi:hypothetical protein